MLKKTLVSLALIGMTCASNASNAGELVIAGRDSSYGKALQFIADAYQQQHPDTKITLIQQPGKALYDSLALSMRAKNGNYDVIMLDDTWAPEFMQKGWLVSLPSSLASQPFIPSLARLGQHAQHDYAVPMVGNVAMFAWNKAVFEQYQLAAPTTWKSVKLAADRIHADQKMNGVVFRGVKGNPVVTGFLPLLWGYGADVIDADGKAALDTPQARQALDMFLSLKDAAPKGVNVYNADEVRDAMQKRSAAIALEVWPAWVPDLDNPAISKVVNEMEITTPPSEIGKTAPMLGIWQLAIPVTSKNPATAESFLSFAASETMQKTLALEFGIPPTRAALYQDAELVAKYRWYPAQLSALEHGKARPRIQNWAEVESILGDYLQLALNGQMNAEQALQQAQQRISRALKS